MNFSHQWQVILHHKQHSRLFIGYCQLKIAGEKISATTVNSRAVKLLALALFTVPLLRRGVAHSHNRLFRISPLFSRREIWSLRFATTGFFSKAQVYQSMFLSNLYFLSSTLSQICLSLLLRLEFVFR